MFECLANLRLELNGLCFQHRGGGFHRATHRLDVLEGDRTGDGFNPSNPRRHAALADNLEQTNVAGATDVRAAAKFFRRADFEHAHFIAVLFAKQHHGARFLRRLQRHYLGTGRLIAQDLGVYECLYVGDFRAGHRRIVGKVKSRLVGINQRTLLLHVIPEHRAQRLVHQVGRRMVSHRPRPNVKVHIRLHAVTDAQGTGRQLAVMAEHIRL